MSQIHAVPTNIITGFLGVGKTTAIMHLLKTKPANERWAVLVNEFGEIGVDGALISGNNTEEQGVFIREVPGGCMCCTSGLPMQIALNMLLAKAKPDRLLIEPSGLGHPVEVMQSLKSEHYKNVLDIRATLTLVDPRKIADSRYTQHPIFQQQLVIADRIVASKQDLSNEEDLQRFTQYLKANNLDKVPVNSVTDGAISLDWLSDKTQFEIPQPGHAHHHAPSDEPSVNDRPIPEQGFVTVTNQGQGFQSQGWRFSPDWIFSRKKVFSLLMGLQAMRVKAVFITDEGIWGYNKQDDLLKEVSLDETSDSRIELIMNSVPTMLQKDIEACVIERN